MTCLRPTVQSAGSSPQRVRRTGFRFRIWIGGSGSARAGRSCPATRAPSQRPDDSASASTEDRLTRHGRRCRACRYRGRRGSPRWASQPRFHSHHTTDKPGRGNGNIRGSGSPADTPRSDSGGLQGPAYSACAGRARVWPQCAGDLNRQAAGMAGAGGSRALLGAGESDAIGRVWRRRDRLWPSALLRASRAATRDVSHLVHRCFARAHQPPRPSHLHRRLVDPAERQHKRSHHRQLRQASTSHLLHRPDRPPDPPQALRTP